MCHRAKSILVSKKAQPYTGAVLIDDQLVGQSKDLRRSISSISKKNDALTQQVAELQKKLQSVESNANQSENKLKDITAQYTKQTLQVSDLKQKIVRLNNERAVLQSKVTEVFIMNDFHRIGIEQWAEETVFFTWENYKSICFRCISTFTVGCIWFWIQAITFVVM